MSVRLLSSDGEEFVLRKEVAEQSVFIENMMVEGEPDSAIPLPCVTGTVLKKVIEWCKHHIHDTAEATEQRRRTTELDEWDQQFFQTDLLFDIINAANYLDIKDLLSVGCLAVAHKIKGMNPNELTKIFNIVNDFTPEEEAQMARENNWVEDQ